MTYTNKERGPMKTFLALFHIVLLPLFALCILVGIVAQFCWFGFSFGFGQGTEFLSDHITEEIVKQQNQQEQQKRSVA